MSGIYYHFIRINDAGQPFLGYDDNRIVTVGETITVDGEPELCTHGLHASKRAIDALKYVPDGHIALCEVTLGGIVKRGAGHFRLACALYEMLKIAARAERLAGARKHDGANRVIIVEGVCELRQCKEHSRAGGVAFIGAVECDNADRAVCFNS